MRLKEFFVESNQAINEGIDHPEDLIISQGSAGAERVVKELAGLTKDTSTVTVKWDGFPAVIFGRDLQGNLVFTDKHMYDKVANGKMEFTTIREYDEARGAVRTDLWEKESILRPVLEQIVPNAKDSYYMGDLMWTGTPKTEGGFFVFKPNTVEYRVKINSKLGENIAKSAGGIAVHTYISGLGQNDQPLVGLKGLSNNAGITFLVGEMQDKPRVLVNKELLAQTQATISQHKQAVDKFINELTAIKGKMVITAMSPFITSMLEDNDIATDIVPRFLDFLKGRLSQAAAQKLLGANQDGWLYQEDGGAPGLLGIWSMWAAVTDLKLHVKRQIDTQQQGSEVIAITDGAESHEGYVFGTGQSKLKLIDRLGFSRANFARYKVADDEIAAKQNGPMAAFCFGRMNPPTIGHKLVMEKTVEVGNGNAFIFLSNSHNADTDPLDPSTKSAFIKKIYPKIAGRIVGEAVQGPIQAANYLYDKGFRNITFVAGSDRLGKAQGSLEKLLNSWNSGPVRTTDNARGPTGREHVVLNFVSSGDRDADSDNVTGVSGTLARRYASEGNEKGFQQATGVGNNIKVNGKTLYQAVREGMGIVDEPIKGQHMKLNDLMPVSEGEDPITAFRKSLEKGEASGKSEAEKQAEYERNVAKFAKDADKYSKKVKSKTEGQVGMAGVGMGNYVVDKSTSNESRGHKVIADKLASKNPIQIPTPQERRDQIAKREADKKKDKEVDEAAAWQKKSGKNKNGGLNQKGVDSYRRENPGSKLQTAVTKKPSELKPGSKDAKRRKSFCARMGGSKGPMKKPNGEPTRKALALRKWHCESIEDMAKLIENAERFLAEAKVDEKWTKKYKDSINCSNPKGFSQKAHCAGKKTNEAEEDKEKYIIYLNDKPVSTYPTNREAEYQAKLIAQKFPTVKININKEVCTLSPVQLEENLQSIEEETQKQRLDPKCWKGYRKQGTKMKDGTRVNNCVKVSEEYETQIDALVKLLESK